MVQGGRRTSAASGAIGLVNILGTSHIHAGRPESARRHRVRSLLAAEYDAVRPRGRNEWSQFYLRYLRLFIASVKIESQYSRVPYGVCPGR